MQPFTCDRTCPLHNETWCRFRPVLDVLGPVQVNSHTVQVKVQLKDPEALKLAVESMSGTWIGMGDHWMNETHRGHAFKLPNWYKMLILKADGELVFDDYKNRWGDVRDIEKLKAEYSISKAILAAQGQGWQYERVPEGLKVYHPSSGHMIIGRNGTAEAFGFSGVGCHDSLMALGIEGEFTAKEELGQVKAETQIACQ